MNSMTHHARTRCQQRGIPPLIVDWLNAYGARTRANMGAELVWFDKDSRRRIRRDVGKQVVDRLGALLDAYLILGEDGVVVTVGWRYEHITRH